MIFLFPDLETLRIALTSGQVPASVALAPAEVAFDAEGRPSLKVHAIPPKPMQNALKRMGVKVGKAHGGAPIEVGSWAEILPVVKEPGTSELSSSAPVLFEMPAGQLSTFATEMLRLGNDRQSFRYLAGADADGKVLLRVIGPPYYTLLRALDRLNADVSAYVEKVPRVWIEIGCAHPMAGHLKVPEGRVLLLRPGRKWTTIEDGPFHDIYDVLDFQLPSTAVDFEEGKLQGKLTVPLRLAAGNAAEVAEMWVLKDNAIEVFDAFVRDADDRLMGRLMFAVAENGAEGPAVVLRTRPSKLPPPAVELGGAAGFVPFRKMNNLFLPAGSRLQPTLRRDAVRKMLADDPAQVVWLTSLGEGRFVPETLPDDAFRPLSDWVDYVIDRERQALQSWVQATHFDFESFVCKDDQPAERPKTPGPKPKTRQPSDKTKDEPDDEPVDLPEKTKGKKKGEPKIEEEAFAVEAAAPPSELKIKRDELEKEFLAVDGPLEAPERQALWPKLAVLNAGLGDLAEASICWLNGLWERDDLPVEWLKAWLASEAETGQESPLRLRAVDFDRELKRDNVTPGDMRRLAAMILLGCAQSPPPEALKKRWPEIRRHLENHEADLGVRVVWLVWRHLSRISGDVLGLARVRDHLVKRLLEQGLRPQHDVPTFIRFSGQRDSDRLRQVQDHLLRVRGEVHAWLAQQDKAKDVLHKSLTPTGCYADLIVAYGLAKVGEERNRDEFKASALARLRSDKSGGKSDKVPLFLADAFEHRIGQAANNAGAGALPAAILKTLDGMDPGLIYGVNRLRKQLHILEPHEKSDPYLVWKKQNDSNLNRDLAALQLVTDPKKLQAEIKRIILNGGRALRDDERLCVLIETIPLTPRVGEAFAAELLDLVLPALVPRKSARSARIDAKDIELPAKLIDAAVPIAANYGWSELLQKIVTRYVENLRQLDEVEVIESINLALGQWLRALRKCGLKDQLESLLKDLTELLLQGRSPEQLRTEYGREGKRAVWIEMLRSLTQLAQCWVYFGWQQQALPILDEVRLFLLDNQERNLKERPIVKYAQLACSYVLAIGQFNDLDFVAGRYSELLKRMDVLPNTQTTGNYYSALHLTIVESIVLALVSEDFIMGETARRFLDDDEYLVRRRIHTDMRALLDTSGL